MCPLQPALPEPGTPRLSVDPEPSALPLLTSRLSPAAFPNQHQDKCGSIHITTGAAFPCQHLLGTCCFCSPYSLCHQVPPFSCRVLESKPTLFGTFSLTIDNPAFYNLINEWLQAHPTARGCCTVLAVTSKPETLSLDQLLSLGLAIINPQCLFSFQVRYHNCPLPVISNNITDRAHFKEKQDNF